MLHTTQLSTDTKDSFRNFGIFLLFVILAMQAYYFAQFYQQMMFTILGWGFATAGGIYFWKAASSGRLFSFPILNSKNIDVE